MTLEIYTLLESYRRAFDRLDGDAVAEHYAEPCGIAQAGIYTHWPSLEPVRVNMRELCEAYRRRGYVGARFAPKTFLPQGDSSAVVDVDWRIDWSGANEPWHFSTTYNLIRTEDGWRILLCTAYEEAALHEHQTHARR